MESEWGLKPILFEFGNVEVTSYAFFMLLAIVSGLLVYLYQLKIDNVKNSNSIYIAIFALTFGTIGAKLPILFLYWDQVISADSLDIFFTGRSIVGGLIGGFLGTVLSKKLFHIKEKMGNQLAIPVVVGMAVGRIGCLLTGCCFGTETSLPWGIDFGDGVLRHPTQAYEFIFDILLAFYLYHRKTKGVAPGYLFRMFLTYYMGFRFILEFIRVEEIVFLGLTVFQLLCIITILYVNRIYFIKKIGGSWLWENKRNYHS
jgi:phosphatidylglycerol---prolipoprotein diacylglyceryl transferase